MMSDPLRSQVLETVAKAFDEWRATLPSDRGFNHVEGAALVRNIASALQVMPPPAAPIDVRKARTALTEAICRYSAACHSPVMTDLKESDAVVAAVNDLIAAVRAEEKAAAPSAAGGDNRRMQPNCMDCGLSYLEFPLDLLLPRSQWCEILSQTRSNPCAAGNDGGLLCPACIVKRAAKVPGATCVQAVIEINPHRGATWQ